MVLLVCPLVSVSAYRLVTMPVLLSSACQPVGVSLSLCVGDVSMSACQLVPVLVLVLVSVGVSLCLSVGVVSMSA